MATELPSSEDDVKLLIQSAVTSRASHIRKEAETITMANVRRLLESDLGLEKSALDVYKTLIRELVDEVLLSPENGDDQDEVADDLEEAPQPKKVNIGKKHKQRSAFYDQDSEDIKENNHVEAPKKKKRKKDVVKKGASHNDDADEIQGSGRAEISKKEQGQEEMVTKQEREELGENGSSSQSDVSAEDSDAYERQKSKKARAKTSIVKPVQNRKIEQLKGTIKACGLSIPPQIYKRAKQLPEGKHDNFLIKELQEILKRRGLSSDPSEKEIKAAKRKIAREKDLEGIDTENIITEPRGRRATSQLFAPVYNPLPAEYDSEEDDDGEENKDEDSDNAVDVSDEAEKDYADDSGNSD